MESEKISEVEEAWTAGCAGPTPRAAPASCTVSASSKKKHRSGASQLMATPTRRQLSSLSPPCPRFHGLQQLQTVVRAQLHVRRDGAALLQAAVDVTGGLDWSKIPMPCRAPSGSELGGARCGAKASRSRGAPVVVDLVDASYLPFRRAGETRASYYRRDSPQFSTVWILWCCSGFLLAWETRAN